MKKLLIILFLITASSAFAQRSVFTPRQINYLNSLVSGAAFDTTSIYVVTDSLASDIAAVPGLINDSLDSYLQVGDWSTIVDEYPLNTARLLYQPTGELNLSTAAISSILDLGFTSDLAGIQIGDSLSSIGRDLDPSITSTFSLGKSKYWKDLYLSNYLYMTSAGGIVTGGASDVFFLDVGDATFREGDGNLGSSVTFSGYAKFRNVTNPSPYDDGITLYAVNNILFAMDKDSNITRITGKPYVNNLLNPTLDDTLSIFRTDNLITFDSIQVRVDDSLGIKGTFGTLGLGTTVFGADTIITAGWNTITTFIDPTIEAGNEVYFYFTYIGDTLTFIRWKIYWH